MTKRTLLSHTVFCMLFSLFAYATAIGQSSIPTEELNVPSGSSALLNLSGAIDMPFEIIVAPDTSIATASTSISSTLVLNINTSASVKGVTDIVVRYYTLSEPSYPVTRRIVVHVASSFVETTNDFISIEKNSFGNLIDVLQNDAGIPAGQGMPITIQSVVVANQGFASVSEDQTELIFTPETDFTGMAYVSYTACDTLNNCGLGQLTICVVDSTQSLTADVVNLHTTLGEPVDLPLPGLDFVLLFGPSNGIVSQLSGDIFKYTPNDGFAGLDTVHFELNPGVTRTFVINVHDKTMNYHALGDKVYVRPSNTVEFNVLENDPLEYPVQDYTQPTDGSISFLGDGAFSYTPEEGFKGVDKITYTTCFEDSVYCESAIVYIFVGDLEPKNESVYNFTTYENVPIIINYDIPFDDYQWIFKTNPDPGSLLEIQNGQSFQVECQMIEGPNILEYAPASGFIGNDYFEILHCPSINDPSICQLVKVNVEVIPRPDEVICACVEDCVWQGDVNNDGEVNMEDLLTLGWYLGENGPQRNIVDSSAWIGEEGPDWILSQPFTGENLKYADANGDGLLSHLDTTAISDNYYDRHTLVAKSESIKAEYPFSITPVAFSLDSGDLIVLDIAIGNENNPVLDMHGFSFSLNVPTWMLDSNSLQVDFHEASWLAMHSTSLSLDEVPWDGRIDAGFTRAHGNVVSGFGVVATVSFIVEDDIEGIRSGSNKIPITVELNNGMGYNGEGQRVSIPGDSYTYYLDLTEEVETDLDKSTIIFPNPSTDLINIHVNGKNALSSVELYNMMGQPLRSFNDLSEKQLQISTSNLANGIYVARISTDKGVVTKKFEVVRN